MSEWQPIETAPMDGTDVIVFGDGDIVIASFGSCYHSPDSWAYNHGSVGYENTCSYIEPTHWMLLPEKPDET